VIRYIVDRTHSEVVVVVVEDGGEIIFFSWGGFLSYLSSFQVWSSSPRHSFPPYMFPWPCYRTPNLDAPAPPPDSSQLHQQGGKKPAEQEGAAHQWNGRLRRGHEQGQVGLGLVWLLLLVLLFFTFINTIPVSPPSTLFRPYRSTL